MTGPQIGSERSGQPLPRASDPPIAKETLRGGAFLAARYGLGVLVSTGNMLVMTWWLGPHIYGLFVTAISLVAFLASISRIGVDTFLVRHESSPTSAMYETANAIILATSLALVALSVLTTPLLIRWYGNHEFVWPYLVLLSTIPMTGLTGVPMAKLERELNFRKIAAIELAGQSAGLVAAIILAVGKAGVWAPVAGQIVWQFVTLVATVRAAGLGVGVRFHTEHWRPMCSFGAGMTLSMRTWQLRTLVNPLLVGRFAGTETVAFVALAIRIAESLGTFRLAAGRIAIAALARMQDQHRKFQSALERALFLQVIILGPLLCIFSLTGPFVLRHMLGVRWMPSLAVSFHCGWRSGEFDLQPAGFGAVCARTTVDRASLLRESRSAAGSGNMDSAAALGNSRLWLGGIAGVRIVLCDSPRRERHAADFMPAACRAGCGIHRRPLFAFRSFFARVKIAYLSNRFPSAVEPYVVDEIRELRNRGAKVVACSILQPQRRSGTDGSTAVNKVLYMRPMRITQIFGATWLCIRGLWKLRDLLARVIVGNESLNRKVRATAHTWLGAYLAILLRERNVDHIHVHHGYYGSWVAMVAARLLGIRFSMTLHGSDVLLHGAYLDLKLANCAFCITISEFNRRYILDHCREASPEKILVQRIGVACPQVSGGQPRHREAGSPLNLLAVGRLHPVKDHAFLIRACRQLKDRGMNFTCAIAGDGAERNSLLRLIRELNLVHEVRLLGHVAHEDVESLYEQTDVVVLTSRSEGIPLVLMEAMAHGKPVLAPNITGIPELITDGETGFLYAAGSIDNFVQRLEMIRDTYSGLGPLCRAARQKVLEDFDRGKNLAAFCDCLLGRINHSEKEQGREDPLLQQI